MAREPIIPVRLSLERKAVWEAAAKAAGESLAEYVRQAVEARVAGASAPAAAKPAGAAARAGKPGRARTELCIHRRRPDEHCSRCDL